MVDPLMIPANVKFLSNLSVKLRNIHCVYASFYFIGIDSEYNLIIKVELYFFLSFVFLLI